MFKNRQLLNRIVIGCLCFILILKKSLTFKICSNITFTTVLWGWFHTAVNEPFIKNVNIKNNKICSYLVFQWQMFYPLLICIIRRKKHAITAWVLPLGFCKGLYHCGHPKIPLWNILIQKLFCTVNSGEKNWIWGSTYLLYPLILYVLFLILASSFYL